MSGPTHTSADLDTRRRKIMFRAWHRGMREMDLVFGGFCDAMIRSLSDEELDQLETLMAENDQDLFKWIMGEKPVPREHDTAIYRKILAHRDQMTF